MGITVTLHLYTHVQIILVEKTFLPAHCLKKDKDVFV